MKPGKTDAKSVLAASASMNSSASQALGAIVARDDRGQTRPAGKQSAIDTTSVVAHISSSSTAPNPLIHTQEMPTKANMQKDSSVAQVSSKSKDQQIDDAKGGSKSVLAQSAALNSSAAQALDAAIKSGMHRQKPTP